MSVVQSERGVSVGQILGNSSRMQGALAVARRFADTPLPILLIGETGTGKELFARQIHLWSNREGQFVDVDCGAMPRELIEGLLFGRQRGAFTGAIENAAGLIEAADRGTLFLDELSSLPFDGQSKLLRVLETGRVRRVGATEPRVVNVRLVAAVQPSVRDQVAEGQVRLDLIQRLAGVCIELPSLAQRPEDIPVLAQHFAHARGCVFDAESLAMLSNRQWPGNVRELRGTVSRACHLFRRDAPGASSITSDAVADAIRLGPGAMLHAGGGMDGVRLVEFPEARRNLLAICEAHNGDAERAAAALGIGRATLYRRLKRVGIRLRDTRG